MQILFEINMILTYLIIIKLANGTQHRLYLFPIVHLKWYSGFPVPKLILLSEAQEWQAL